MFMATTFYDAFRASQGLPRRRDLDQFSALHAWATIALIANDRTRPYMAELIRDKQSGLHWTFGCSCAARDAMAELARDKGRDRTRVFEQHRKAAMKALREVSNHMAAIGDPLPLEVLLGDLRVREFKEVVAEFVRTQWLLRRSRGVLARKEALQAGKDAPEAGACALKAYISAPEARVPDADFLLKAIAKYVEVLPRPKADRYTARAIYVRALFSALAHSEIRQRRVAFLTHACAAVFGVHIEKRDLRRLVKDLAAAEKEQAELGALFDAGDERALLERISPRRGC